MTTPAVLESHVAITDLVHRYAYNIRMGQGAKNRGLFTEDATFEVREVDFVAFAAPVTRATFNGRDAIIDHIRTPPPNIRICPLISNLLIQIDGTDASSNAVMTAHMFPGGNALMGEYHDRYSFAGHAEDGGWRFSARIYTIFKSDRP